MKKILLLSLLSYSISSIAQTQSSTTTTSTIVEKNDLKKSEFVKTNFPYLSIGDWKPGMKFTAEPQAAGNYSSEIDLVAYKNKRLTAPRLQQGDFQGKIFTFVGYEKRRDEKCVDDNCSKTYIVFECEGTRYEYSSFFTLGALKEYTEASVTNLVFLDDNDKLKSLIEGKQIFVQDVDWYDEDHPKGISKGKYLPINIISIDPGTQDGPAKIRFKVEGDENEYFVNTRLSGINKATGQYGVDFDRVFTFDNPKNKYPDISEINWKSIQHKLVIPGMTKDECVLAWGKAQQTNSITTDGVVIEKWYYPSGKVIKFRNAIVEKLE